MARKLCLIPSQVNNWRNKTWASPPSLTLSMYTHTHTHTHTHTCTCLPLSLGVTLPFYYSSQFKKGSFNSPTWLMPAQLKWEKKVCSIKRSVASGDLPLKQAYLSGGWCLLVCTVCKRACGHLSFTFFGQRKAHKTIHRSKEIKQII